MKQITAEEFQAAVTLDPAWASTITEPVEITGYCNMGGSHITHLSPLLHFTGDKAGGCANFSRCRHLKIAEGHFSARVSFKAAGIEKIGDLTVTRKSTGSKADFLGCRKLEHNRIPREFLGEDTHLNHDIRETNLRRYALAKAAADAVATAGP